MREILFHWHHAKLPIDVAAVQGAFAERMKANPFNDLARLIRAGDMGHGDARGICLERTDVVAVTAATNAHEGVDVVDAGGADLVFHPDPVIGHVLGAKPLSVDPAQRGDFGNPRIREVDLQDRGELLFAQQGKDTASSL